MMNLKFIGIILLFAAIGYAAIPDEITDPKQRDALEYIDGKTSTMGLVEAPSVTGTTAVNIFCPTGTYIVVGGCNSGSTALTQSYKLSNTSWRCSCISAVSITAYATCSAKANP